MAGFIKIQPSSKEKNFTSESNMKEAEDSTYPRPINKISSRFNNIFCQTYDLIFDAFTLRAKTTAGYFMTYINCSKIGYR
ncbi:hypothetical protein [Nostoc sp. MG11]|uniref:hypothetical protein n=1 Tax=Nostoc sp. MG11 TaxID=2721166 RepID=UPI001D01DDFE|nr:hypothetical protein [Nostoc sp. MG11]